MRRFRLRTLRRFVAVLLIFAMIAITLRWISLEKWRRKFLETEPVEQVEEQPKPRSTAAPLPLPTKPPVIAGKLDTGRLFNGITLHAALDPAPGGAASDERADPESYVLELKLHARVPQPNKSIDDLAKVNGELPKALPGLAAMITPESVSPLFKELYETKLRLLRENLARLDQLLSRHNFYDTQTVLNLRHPGSHRRVILLQADMDVDADGSDSDRLPAGSGISATFKPFTSYKWGKKTPAPNPYSASAEEKLKRFEGELAAKTTPPERKRDLKSAIAQLRDEIETMKKFSFLIGATDPYIVLPGNFARADAGKVGDYAIVIFNDKIYPAIVGDVGPTDKTGEASLRIAKEINPAANPNNRSVSDLKITYLVFPGTAETPFGPPDLEKLQVRCEALVKEIGGAGVPLHHWENIIPPPPTPTPTATPSPTPTPADSARPSASPAATFAFPTATPSASP